MMVLMCKEYGIRELNYSDPNLREPRLNDNGAKYSKELKDLVQSCVRYKQEDRPMFQELRRRIKHLTGDNDEDFAIDLAGGMRSTRVDKVKDREQLLKYPTDKYAFGMSWTQEQS